jgi:hypothetical protein
MAAPLPRSSIDPLAAPHRQHWWKVELVLLTFLLTAIASLYWIIGVYAPSRSGESVVELGMTKQEVVGILGAPNEDRCF